MASNGDGLYEQVRTENGWEYTFPDQLSFNKEPFATVIPYRSTTFKVHKTEGLANSALAHHRQGAKYKQMNGVWVKVWEFYTPSECESCGNALCDDDRRVSYSRRGEYFRSPLHKGSSIFAPFLCRSCFDQEDAVVQDRNKAREWRKEEKRREAFAANNTI